MQDDKKGRKSPKYIPKSPRQIIALTRILVKLVGSTTNLFDTLEVLKRFFPKLRIRYVANRSLPMRRRTPTPRNG
jgi:hypothetical protein